MITIDAKNKTLGRVASAAAFALLGKHTTTYAKNVVAGEEVKIINAKELRISGTKATDKEYLRYSGYPGGLKGETYEMLTARRGTGEVLRRAVLGMLPKNRLQAKRIKLLTIEQ